MCVCVWGGGGRGGGGGETARESPFNSSFRVLCLLKVQSSRGQGIKAAGINSLITIFNLLAITF